MKFAIFRGHNTVYNSGAVGILEEEYMINELSSKLIPILRNAGHTVIDCTPTEEEFSQIKSTTDSLRLRCQKANAENVDIVVSLHFNYFNGSASGSEIFYVSNAGKSIAQPVLSEIVSLGFKNRGVKKSTSLYVLNHTMAPAILVEGCFCDSQTDVDLFDPQKMAESIARGLVGDISPVGKKIATAPTASKSQCISWATPKFLTSEYKTLLNLYYEKCPPLGLNPVVLFSQMCYETGFLYKVDSTAGIDASYHNPCGLKTTSGGSPTDPSAHAKFSSWDEGCQAHVDHMALYVGIDGYPKSDTPDPRHFPYLFKTISTVEDLGSSWTTSPTYSQTLLDFCSEIEASSESGNEYPNDIMEIIKALTDEINILSGQIEKLESQNETIQNELSQIQTSLDLLSNTVEINSSDLIPIKDFIEKTLAHYKYMT